ncbi:NAD(P)H-binding protein [Aquimarina sp. AU474]|uniref:NAD(P)H-binding protein n=1 Tax=Aquimarina sp. AU474 TaxID=2108529 RepID=UPI000D69FFB4|nr:NAD(P)H-binding protein [Aquimarina sp. AU474]
MNPQISILGTGWLGLPLSQNLIGKNYVVKGSTTSQDKLSILKDKGILAYSIALNEQGPKGDITSFLDGSIILIINIPPGLRRNPETNYVAKIKNLIPHIAQSTIEKVLFVSSTSVFADQEEFPLISQETAPNASSNAGKQLIEVEKLLQNSTKFKTTILRFAGLFDSRRHPARMLSKRKNIKNPKAPVNLIHREDCIGVIEKIIETDSWNSVFNASYPDHPQKALYYTKVCEQMGLPKPDYNLDTVSKGKVIDSENITKTIDYAFKIKL